MRDGRLILLGWGVDLVVGMMNRLRILGLRGILVVVDRQRLHLPQVERAVDSH